MKIADRILLQLSRHYGHVIEVVAPWAMTQNGIASGVGAERKNVAIPLNSWLNQGALQSIKGTHQWREIDEEDLLADRQRDGGDGAHLQILRGDSEDVARALQDSTLTLPDEAGSKQAEGEGA